VRLVGEVADPAPLYALMDIVAMPTYREGFGNVLLEAAAMGLPVVASRVPGCVDAVVDGLTGTLVPVRDVDALADALDAYLRNPTLRRVHGDAARHRAFTKFRPETIWKLQEQEYRAELAARAGASPLGGTDEAPSGGSSRLQRLFDVGMAAVALVLLAPVVATVAICVRVALGRPVLFSQVRPGRGGRPFTMYKFRSMTDAVGRDGRPLSDAERLTRFGRFLRSTSLDELPELWNVLRGDMSLVGPRPLLMEYLPLYSPEQARRHEVRPGVTGWAQVRGRNAIDWEDRLRLDVWYVDNRTLWLDLRILAMTVLRVLRRDGVSHPGHATMERFRGSRA
jgi:lipopolysaccharide/colanic/teichoic acid biosynthesis glycosyltransferase